MVVLWSSIVQKWIIRTNNIVVNILAWREKKNTQNKKKKHILKYKNKNSAPHLMDNLITTLLLKYSKSVKREKEWLQIKRN